MSSDSGSGRGRAKEEVGAIEGDAAPADSSRRRFLKWSAGSGAALAAAAPLSAVADGRGRNAHDDNHDNAGRERAAEALRLRVKAAEQHFRDTLRLPPQRRNGDEQRYRGERFYASFAKALPCNRFGEVDPGAFRGLRRALRTGRPEAFDAVELDATAQRPLVNPQGAFKFELAGIDSHATRIKPSHTFRGPELAGEMAEVYWQALTRDVAYINYDSNALVAAAAADLNAFAAPPGPTDAGQITPGTLFRGATPGDMAGPFISQYLLKDVSYGPTVIEQRYEVPLPGSDFMKDEGNWLNVQRGGLPDEGLVFDGTRRYLHNNRALGEYVHRDVSFQAYFNAALMLLGLGGDALDRGNPYAATILNQEGFTSLGPPFVLDLVTKAANLALTGAWYQKWRVHRLLRPEAYAARVHFNMTGQRAYEVHPDIVACDAVGRVRFAQGTALLPLAFPEGSPVHPSYPAGHACVAGACVTTLKAFFDEEFVLADPVQADAHGDTLLPYSGDDLTVGGELNKLAANISIGRDAAGVHYRQDGIDGLLAGEQQGIALLQDHSRTANETSGGFTLTKFDGTRINIFNGRVRRV